MSFEKVIRKPGVVVLLESQYLGGGGGRLAVSFKQLGSKTRLKTKQKARSIRIRTGWWCHLDPSTPETEAGKPLVQSDPGLCKTAASWSYSHIHTCVKFLTVVCQKGIPDEFLHIY